MWKQIGFIPLSVHYKNFQFFSDQVGVEHQYCIVSRKPVKSKTPIKSIWQPEIDRTPIGCNEIATSKAKFNRPTASW